MPTTLIGSKWVNGSLEFYNKSTGLTLMRIGPSSVWIRQVDETSPSSSPSVSPSASPSS